jgi:hypothetical protein
MSRPPLEQWSQQRLDRLRACRRTPPGHRDPQDRHRLADRQGRHSIRARIGWYGSAPGTAPSFYHTWYLKPQGDTCLVVTDEVGKGNDAAHLRETDESLKHRGHDLWLATLKWTSEGK